MSDQPRLLADLIRGKTDFVPASLHLSRGRVLDGHAECEFAPLVLIVEPARDKTLLLSFDRASAPALADFVLARGDVVVEAWTEAEDLYEGVRWVFPTSKWREGQDATLRARLSESPLAAELMPDGHAGGGFELVGPRFGEA